MAIPFARSMRALESDDFRTSLVGLLIVTLLLAAWIAWLFLARVTLYETSSTAHLASPSTLVASFAPTALVNLRPGQAAQVQFDDFSWTQYGTVPATVERVDSQLQAGHVQVELALHPPPASAIPLQPGLTGQVQVQVGRVTPVTLVLHAAGRLFAGPASPSQSR